MNAGQGSLPNQDPLAGFAAWLDQQADYPSIAEGSERRIYLRGHEARELLARAWFAGWNAGRAAAPGSGTSPEVDAEDEIEAAYADPQSAPGWTPDTSSGVPASIGAIIGQAAAELARRESVTGLGLGASAVADAEIIAQLNRIYAAVDYISDLEGQDSDLIIQMSQVMLNDVIEGRGLSAMAEYVKRFCDVLDSAEDADRIAADI